MLVERRGSPWHVVTTSKQLLERLDRQAGVLHDRAHGLRVDGIVSWDGENADPVGHDDVFALADD
jgi:hypothetical protein